MEYNKYNDGLIYKIWFGNTIYIGSTTDLPQRINEHKRDYKKYKNGNFHFCGSYAIFELTDDYQYEEIEKFSCNNKLELTARERQYILFYKNNSDWDCCNKQIPTGIMISPAHNRIEYGKEYYQKNKEKHKKNEKEYYQKNKEKLNTKSKEYSRQYRLDNRDEINRKKREIYKLKKEMPMLIEALSMI